MYVCVFRPPYRNASFSQLIPHPCSPPIHTHTHIYTQLDITVANPKSLQGRALRNLTHSVYTVAGYTPVVGPRIRTIMIDLHPDHMARAPRLMDRPALDTSVGDDVDGDIRGSFDKDMDDVSVMTDEMEEEVNEKQSGKKQKKDKSGKRKDKRFLQNMGKGIKKVMNYPKTPVHEDMPAHVSAVSVTSGRDSPNQSIATEEIAALASSSISSAAQAASTSSMGSATGASRKFFGSSRKNLKEGEILPVPPHA